MPLQDTIRQIRTRVESMDWFQLTALIVGLLLCYYFLKNLKGFCDNIREDCCGCKPQIENKTQQESIAATDDKKVS